MNRGKRSLAIDFTRPEGRKLLLGLVERCDVLAENFKVGDLKRYGLDYESVRKVNPSIVYCSITGYGQDGPMASQPGYDPVFQAISGIMSTCGLPDGMPGSGPMRSMLPLVDVMTGMVSTSAILGALLHRKGTGEGQHLDIALLDVALAATVHLGQTYLSTGKLPQRAGNGSLLFAPSNCYPCVEGHILIQIGNDFQWTRLCKCLGKEDWLEDPRFVTNASRMTLSRELDLLLSEITRTWDKQTLSELLGKSGVPCGPVNNLAQAFEHPQVKHRELKMELEHPVYGKLAQIRSPLRFSETPAQYRIPPLWVPIPPMYCGRNWASARKCLASCRKQAWYDAGRTRGEQRTLPHDGPACAGRRQSGPGTHDVGRADLNIGILRALTQGMLHDNQRQQGFGNRRRTYADAGVMPALGHNLCRPAAGIYGLARRDDGTGGFNGNRHFQVLPGADAAQHTASVVGLETFRRQRIAMRGAALRDAGKPGADFNALDGVDAHHGKGDVGIELVIQRLTQPTGTLEAVTRMRAPQESPALRKRPCRLRVLKRLPQAQKTDCSARVPTIQTG